MLATCSKAFATASSFCSLIFGAGLEGPGTFSWAFTDTETSHAAPSTVAARKPVKSRASRTSCCIFHLHCSLPTADGTELHGTNVANGNSTRSGRFRPVRTILAWRPDISSTQQDHKGS